MMFSVHVPLQSLRVIRGFQFVKFVEKLDGKWTTTRRGVMANDVTMSLSLSITPQCLALLISSYLFSTKHHTPTRIGCSDVPYWNSWIIYFIYFGQTSYSMWSWSNKYQAVRWTKPLNCVRLSYFNLLYLLKTVLFSFTYYTIIIWKYEDILCTYQSGQREPF